MYLDVGNVGGSDDFFEITQGVRLGERVDQLVLDDGLLDLNTGHAEVRHKLLEGPVAFSSLDYLRCLDMGMRPSKTTHFFSFQLELYNFKGGRGERPNAAKTRKKRTKSRAQNKHTRQAKVSIFPIN